MSEVVHTSPTIGSNVEEVRIIITVLLLMILKDSVIVVEV